MIEKIISWSVHNRFFVWICIIAMTAAGIYSMLNTPIDAIPDLSENQVIIYTEWMGRNPQIIEDQITYPLVSNLQGLPEVKAIRANSMFGMSFIFVIFEDETNIYWARTRVMERLNYAQRLLPQNVIPTLGPDGTGVGHIFWYTISGRDHNLAELRTLQDWYVKFALQNVEGVTEVASYGGFEKQYQIAIDPHRLTYYNLSFADILRSVNSNNRDVGGGTYELNSMGYMIRGLGYIKNIDDVRNISVATNNSIPIKIGDIATVQLTGAPRLGITEENGEGETVGGIVVMRYNENPKEVIDRVKERMKDLQKGLPKGVKFKVVYDRGNLIEAAIDTLREALIEEIIIVSLMVIIFIFHVRSALAAVLTIPLTLCLGFIVIYFTGVSLNIMSLGGIALAIGDVIDPGIVMVENAYRRLADETQGLEH